MKTFNKHKLPAKKNIKNLIFPGFPIYFSKNTSTLTSSEEIDLFEKYKNGCLKSRNKIISSQYLLVKNLVKKLKKNNFSDYNDLIQEGLLGVFDALKTFDPNKGRFSTICYHHIKNKILRSISQDYSVVRMPESEGKRKLLYNLNKIKKDLDISDEFFENKKIEIIKKQLRVTSKDVLYINSRLKGDFSLNKKINNNEDNYTDHQDLLEDNSYEDYGDIENYFLKNFQENDDKIKLSKINLIIKNKLDKRQKYVLQNRGFFSDKKLKLKVIAKFLQISEERVRQIENESIKIIKNFIFEDLKKAS